MSENTQLDADPLDRFFVSDEELAEIQSSTMASSSLRRRAADEDGLEMMSFHVGRELYALAVSDVLEILILPSVTEVPRIDRSVVGIISLRGAVVPLVDLRRMLKLDEAQLTRAARVLVVGSSADPVGLLVDDVVGVTRIAADTVGASPVNAGDGESSNELIEGIGHVDGDVMIILDARGVLRRVAAKVAAS